MNLYRRKDISSKWFSGTACFVLGRVIAWENLQGFESLDCSRKKGLHRNGELSPEHDRFLKGRNVLVAIVGRE
jgi:hypothetical protein